MHTQSNWCNFILVEIVTPLCFLLFPQAQVNFLNSSKQILQDQAQHNIKKTIDEKAYPLNVLYNEV